MIHSLAASKVTLYELRHHFDLTLTTEPEFFLEWVKAGEPLSLLEKQLLDRAKANFLYLNQFEPLLEETVKMVILSPLLDLAGFYQAPFRIKTEAEVQITAQDGDVEITGQIDVLVLLDRLWVVVVESKRADFSLNKALPQALAYMLNSPALPSATSSASFGLITNGIDFIFLKLHHQTPPQYALSRVFSLLNPGNDLHDVLQVLKHLGQLIMDS